MVSKSRIDFRFFEGVDFPVFQVAQSGRKALAYQSEKSKHVVAGATGVG